MGIRTADYIFEHKGVYKMFDLKTIMQYIKMFMKRYLR